jgi:hypothetical protein
VGESTGDPVVDQALDELASVDAELAEMARSGFGSLTWGQGLAAVTAHGLADFLWYQLPTKWMCGLDEKLEIAAALADLFAGRQALVRDHVRLAADGHHSHHL